MLLCKRILSAAVLFPRLSLIVCLWFSWRNTFNTALFLSLIWVSRVFLFASSSALSYDNKFLTKTEARKRNKNYFKSLASIVSFFTIRALNIISNLFFPVDTFNLCLSRAIAEVRLLASAAAIRSFQSNHISVYYILSSSDYFTFASHSAVPKAVMASIFASCCLFNLSMIAVSLLVSFAIYSYATKYK